jgi:hypothetical protein
MSWVDLIAQADWPSFVAVLVLVLVMGRAFSRWGYFGYFGGPD